MNRPISVILTWDIDPTPEVTIENKRLALLRVRQFLSDEQIESTFFLPARMAEPFVGEIGQLLQDGHEIGCHGLTHDDDEDCAQMPEDLLRRCLHEATDILRKSTGLDMHSFRGPHVKTSATTQRILAELGYTADCSVASQRIDFISSNLINVGWIVAPRLPYRPSHKSAFRRGSQNIWVVPLSAVVLPFISSALYVFRLSVMKWLFRVLYAESRRTGKPIVYLVHPFELVSSTGPFKPENLSLIQSIRAHGFLVRERFYEKDYQERFRMNEELIGYMRSFPCVRFRTVRNYVSEELMSRSGLPLSRDGAPAER